MKTIHPLCGRTFSRMHCGNCCESFASLAGFDAHRVQNGERGRCVDPSTVAFLHQDENGSWRGTPMSTERLAALRVKQDERSV